MLEASNARAETRTRASVAAMANASWFGVPNEDLAESLCSRAGVGRVSSVEPIALSSFNANLAVTDESGERRVLRRYRPQREPHTALMRLRRERWVHETLAAVGAPVARILASCDEAGSEATLMEFVEGEPLGSLVARGHPEEAESAWRAAGGALAAVHALDAVAAAAAGCEQVGIRDPQSSRGLYHYEEALANLDELGRARPDWTELSMLRATVESARPLYEVAPVSLCQYDTHLWQFMLARRGSAWQCTAILDWEHADLDDPDWDLAQLDVFRFGPVGPTPQAFFAGYGRTPSSPLYTLYRLERAAWVLAAHRRGEEWLSLSAPLAERFLGELLDRTGLLHAAVEEAIVALPDSSQGESPR